MSEKHLFRLVHKTARQRAANACMNSPDGWIVRVSPASRSLDQNAKLHALFGEIAKCAQYMGRNLTAVQWKTLFISGHAIATGAGADMVPGLESEFVNIRESSASMSVARMSSLIEYVMAWCAHNGIEFSDQVQP